MYIQRELTKKLKQTFRQFPIVALIGPRQSGKTTLVKHVFPVLDYVSLEDPDTREFAQSDPRGFLDSYQKGVIIDEAQRLPELFSYLQGIVDKKKKAGQFILTGSQNFLLHQQISQSLAGRVALLKLLPLSLLELESQPTDYEHFLFKGFYPKLYASKIEPNDWYPNYLQTYIERDIRQLKDITNLGAFQKFIKMCAARTGQILNLTTLANDCGITHNTARAWLAVLEASFIVFLLKPHYKNFNKRLIKAPKLYFYDVGLAAHLLGIESSEQIKTHHLKGSLFESLIISELFKKRFNSGKIENCYFWRDKTGHEIDCLIEQGTKLSPLEIKSGKTISSEYFRDLNYWNKLAKASVADSFVVYGGNKNQKRSQAHVLSWRNLAELPV